MFFISKTHTFCFSTKKQATKDFFCSFCFFRFFLTFLTFLPFFPFFPFFGFFGFFSFLFFFSFFLTAPAEKNKRLIFEKGRKSCARPLFWNQVSVFFFFLSQSLKDARNLEYGRNHVVFLFGRIGEFHISGAKSKWKWPIADSLNGFSKKTTNFEFASKQQHFWKFGRRGKSGQSPPAGGRLFKAEEWRKLA